MAIAANFNSNFCVPAYLLDKARELPIFKDPAHVYILFQVIESHGRCQEH